jgi:hypothetical protein
MRNIEGKRRYKQGNRTVCGLADFPIKSGGYDQLTAFRQLLLNDRMLYCLYTYMSNNLSAFNNNFCVDDDGSEGRKSTGWLVFNVNRCIFWFKSIYEGFYIRTPLMKF